MSRVVEWNVWKVRGLARELLREPKIEDWVDPEIACAMRRRSAALNEIELPDERHVLVVEECPSSAHKAFVIDICCEIQATNIWIDPLAANLQEFDQVVCSRMWRLEILTHVSYENRSR